MNNRQLFLQHIAQTSDAPLMLEIEKAEGCWLYDSIGKKYLDLISGIAVSNIGHGHPAVKAAVSAQLEKYMHVMVYGEFVEAPQVQYAKWITDRLPDSLNAVYFTNSGSEATEGAIKLAKRVTGRTEIISFEKSYHGSTMGALSAGNTEERKQAFRPLIPDNTILAYNDISAIQKISHHTAAVLIEPIQAEAGVIIPQTGYLQALRDRCNETGTLLMFDECQTAFGRTGSLFHFTQTGVVPDVLLLGKAVGGGMPLGAFIASREHMHTLAHAPVLGHITTFGGHPVCCAAGLAAAHTLESEHMMERVQHVSDLFATYLKHNAILEVRRAGLMIAVQLPDVEKNLAVVQALVHKGLLIDWFLFAADCLRIAPPLTISDAEVMEACKMITNALDQLS